MTITDPTQHISPLVRPGQPAQFMMLPDEIWHRTERYPTPCTCAIAPKMGQVIKPAMDESWRYVPDSKWAPCLKAVAMFDSDAREKFDLSSLGKPGWIMQVGERVDLDDDAKERFETQGRAEWYVEQVGRGKDGETAPIVRIVDKLSGTWMWAPLLWVKKWEPKPKVDDRSVGMAAPPETEDMIERRRSYSLTFNIVPSDDCEITCVICHKPAVTHEFTHRFGGSRSVQGIHVTCAKAILGHALLRLAHSP